MAVKTLGKELISMYRKSYLRYFYEELGSIEALKEHPFPKIDLDYDGKTKTFFVTIQQEPDCLEQAKALQKTHELFLYFRDRGFFKELELLVFPQISVEVVRAVLPPNTEWILSANQV